MNTLLCKKCLCRFNSIHIFRLLKSNIKTYYDILNLPRNCTCKDVRAAYLKLSKKYHPDVQGPTKSRVQFLQITEAYQTLSKPYLRQRYDQDLLARERMTNGRGNSSGSLHTTEHYRPWDVKPDFEYNAGPYYGVKGLEKVSNSRIVFLLIGLSMFGAIFGFISANVGHYFSSSFKANRKQLDQRNAQAEAHYAAVREDAQKYTSEQQVKRMVDRMTKSSNS